MSAKKNTELQVGDYITCRDAEDLIHTMQELAKNGVDTDFNYDIPNAYRLEVKKVIGDKDGGKVR